MNFDGPSYFAGMTHSEGHRSHRGHHMLKKLEIWSIFTLKHADINSNFSELAPNSPTSKLHFSKEYTFR